MTHTPWTYIYHDTHTEVYSAQALTYCFKIKGQRARSLAHMHAHTHTDTRTHTHTRAHTHTHTHTQVPAHTRIH